AQEQEKPYKKALEAVESKLKVGDFRGAVADLDQIALQYPDAADVYYAKGLLLGQMGDYQGAISSAEMAYSKDGSLQNLNFLMDLYRASQRWDDMVKMLQAYRSKHPMQTFISRELMMTLAGLKKFDDALAVYEEEVREGRRSDTLDVAKAEVLIHQEKLPAVLTLLKPLEGQSSLRQVYSILGYVYLHQEKPKQAVDVLEKGFKITNDPVLYLDLADAYRKEKKTKLAYDALKSAFDSDHVNFGDKHRIMLTMMDAGFRDFSLDQIQSLANILVLRHPRIAESHVIKGNILWRRGNMQEARSLFLTAVGISPTHVDAWRMLINADMAL